MELGFLTDADFWASFLEAISATATLGFGIYGAIEHKAENKKRARRIALIGLLIGGLIDITFKGLKSLASAKGYKKEQDQSTNTDSIKQALASSRKDLKSILFLLDSNKISVSLIMRQVKPLAGFYIMYPDPELKMKIDAFKYEYEQQLLGEESELSHYEYEKKVAQDAYNRDSLARNYFGVNSYWYNANTALMDSVKININHYDNIIRRLKNNQNK